MVLLLVMAAVIAYGAVLGLAMTGSRARRGAVLAVAALALVVPFLLRGSPMEIRGLCAAGVALIFLRVVDLAIETQPLSSARRALHGCAVVEMRRTPRIPRTLHMKALVRVVLMSAIAACAWVVVARVSSPDRASRAVRWFAGIVAAYTTFDAFCALVTLQWSALGFDLARLHDDPIKSRTVAEFWGERWNRLIGRWLRANCFMPLARRRRARLGVVAAFLASTVLHVYLAWAALDANAALMWAIFFSLQIPIVFVERALGVASWPAPAARAWTIGILCAVSPFFVSPVLRGFDVLR